MHLFFLFSLFLLGIMGQQIQAVAFLPDANHAQMPMPITGGGTGANANANANANLPSAATLSPVQNRQLAILNGTLTNKQIRQLAAQMSSLFSDQQFQMFKRIIAAFAPDSWVVAFNKISSIQMRCIMRVSMTIMLTKQMALFRSLMAASAAGKMQMPQSQPQIEEDDGNSSEEQNDYYNGELDNNSPAPLFQNCSADANIFGFGLDDGPASEEEKAMAKQFRANCPRAFQKIVEMSQVFNQTFQKLPPRVLQIIKNFTGSIRALIKNKQQLTNPAAFKTTFIDLLLALKSTTMDERQKVADLFPKLRALITDPRINKLLDLMINCMFSEDKNCKAPMGKLLVDILRDSGILKAFSSVLTEQQ